MGIQGLASQTFAIPLAAGLQQKADERAMQPPGLLLAKDVQFDEIGGLQPRRPYQEIGSGAMSNVRRVVNNGAERVALTKTACTRGRRRSAPGSRRARISRSRSTRPRVFTSAGDQVDADRAELDGIAWYTWVEAGYAYFAAIDVETGAVAMSPVTYGNGADRAPRLVALATKVLWIYQNSGQMYFGVLEPADPGATPPFAHGHHLGHRHNAKYDVCQVGSQRHRDLACKRTTTTSYSLVTITAGRRRHDHDEGARLHWCDRRQRRADGRAGAGDPRERHERRGRPDHDQRLRRRVHEPGDRHDADQRRGGHLGVPSLGAGQRRLSLLRLLGVGSDQRRRLGLVQLEQLGLDRQHARRGGRVQAPVGAASSRVRSRAARSTCGARSSVRRSSTRSARRRRCSRRTSCCATTASLTAKAVMNSAGAGAAASRTTATAGSRAARTSAMGPMRSRRSPVA
jgi:hypothetical protein